MPRSIDVAVPRFAVLIATLCSVAIAAANPLYEQRGNSPPAASSSAKPIVTILRGSVVALSADGRITLDMPSARLIDAGVRSGDAVVVNFGTQSVRAYAAFADELARSARYYLEIQAPVPVDDGMTIVLSRDNPAQRVVLDSSTSDGAMYVPAQVGSTVTFRIVTRGKDSRTD
jgi:hypothetical protein